MFYLNLYKSLMRPYVEYCTPVWSSCYQKDKLLIERVQHRFTRMIPGLSRLLYGESWKTTAFGTLEFGHRSNLEVGCNFFTERLINRWNSLDQRSLDVDSVNCFKNQLQRLRNTRMGFFMDWWSD